MWGFDEVADEHQRVSDFLKMETGATPVLRCESLPPAAFNGIVPVETSAKQPSAESRHASIAWRFNPAFCNKLL
jgi:hypothetical protein